MITAFHGRWHGSFIEKNGNDKRKKLHETNKVSNSLGFRHNVKEKEETEEKLT